MKISEIKDPELRALAEWRQKEHPLCEDDVDLKSAFGWGRTPEGGFFWSMVHQGIITTIPPINPTPDPCPSDYVMD